MRAHGSTLRVCIFAWHLGVKNNFAERLPDIQLSLDKHQLKRVNQTCILGLVLDGSLQIAMLMQSAINACDLMFSSGTRNLTVAALLRCYFVCTNASFGHGYFTPCVTFG